MLFDPRNRTRSPRHRRVAAYAALARIAAEFAAALLFLIGSVLFLDQSTTTLAVWLFVAGSVLFALRPAIGLVREVILIRMGDFERAAKD